MIIFCTIFVPRTKEYIRNNEALVEYFTSFYISLHYFTNKTANPRFRDDEPKVKRINRFEGMGENVKYYSITEAAKMLRVSRPTIYARINSGQMKTVRISERIVRIPESEFAAVEMRYEQTPQIIDTDKMISKEEAMAKYEIGQAYFYRKVKDNGIKAFRYGTKVVRLIFPSSPSRITSRQYMISSP